MCEKCVAAVKKYWPNLPEEKYPELLWNATCFPFGDHEMVARQVKEMAIEAKHDLDRALAIAGAEMTKAMRGRGNKVRKPR